MKKNFLIVGGTGFLGYNIAKSLLNKNNKITILSLSNPKKKRFLPNVEYIKCDISKKKQIKNKLKKNYDYIFNFGGYVDHTNISKTYLSHYVGVKNLSNFFLKKKIQLFVQIGSCLEYGKYKSPQKELSISNPISNYAKSKYEASRHLLKLHNQFNFPCVILRCYQIYGPTQDTNRLIPFVITKCLKDEHFECSNGKQYRDFLYIDDFVELFKKLITKNKKYLFGQIFNIGAGKSYKIKKIINYINNKIGKGKPLYGAIKLRHEESINLYPNIFKVRKILNWKPKIIFKKGLVKTINYYRKIV